MNETNWVRVAVDHVGGVTKASNLLSLSNSAVYDMIDKGRMPTGSDRSLANVRTLAAASGVDALRLVGLDGLSRSPRPPQSPSRRRYRPANSTFVARSRKLARLAGARAASVQAIERVRAA